MGQHELIIEPGRGGGDYWRDLWRYRELFLFLSWRDILVRYKQTVVGVAWSLLRPMLTMIVLTAVFQKLAKLPSQGVPYPILVLAAQLPWQMFSTALSSTSASVVSNAGLVSKVYFPRMIIPASSVVVSLVDLAISSFLLVCLMFWYRFVPTWRVVALPPLILLACMAALGCGLWLSALNVRYRDFQFIVPFLVQLGFYVSPVGFSSNIVPEHWRLLYSVNPMVGVIDGFRWAILGGSFHIYLPGLALSVGLTLLILITGIRYFRNTEKTFADVM